MLLSRQVLAGPVGPAVEGGSIGAGLAIHFEQASIQIHDPVLGHTCASVEAALEVTLDRQVRFSDLDHERETRWFRLRIVTQRTLGHRNVRLRLRFLVESDREQDSYAPLRTECD